MAGLYAAGPPAGASFGTISVDHVTVTAAAGNALQNSGSFVAHFLNPKVQCRIRGVTDPVQATLNGSTFTVSIPTSANTGSGPADCVLLDSTNHVAASVGWEAVITGSTNEVDPSRPAAAFAGTSIELNGSYKTSASSVTIKCFTTVSSSTFPTSPIFPTVDTTHHTFKGTIPTTANTVGELWRCELDELGASLLATSSKFLVQVAGFSLDHPSVTTAAGSPVNNSGSFHTNISNPSIQCFLYNEGPTVNATLNGSTFTVSIPTTSSSGSDQAVCRLIENGAEDVLEVQWEAVLTGSTNSVHANTPAPVAPGTSLKVTGSYASPDDPVTVYCNALSNPTTFPSNAEQAELDTTHHTFSVTIPTDANTVSEVWRCVLYKSTNSGGIFRALAAPITLTVGNPRDVSVSWTPDENTRLAQMGQSLGPIGAADVQKHCVYIISFLLSLGPSTPTPITVQHPGGTSVTYTDTWDTSELPVIEKVDRKFVLNDSDATRASVKIVDFLLSLAGK